jgi:hypothetical protein
MTGLNQGEKNAGSPAFSGNLHALAKPVSYYTLYNRVVWKIQFPGGFRLNMRGSYRGVHQKSV